MNKSCSAGDLSWAMREKRKKAFKANMLADTHSYLILWAPSVAKVATVTTLNSQLRAAEE